MRNGHEPRLWRPETETSWMVYGGSMSHSLLSSRELRWGQGQSILMQGLGLFLEGSIDGRIRRVTRESFSLPMLRKSQRGPTPMFPHFFSLGHFFQLLKNIIKVILSLQGIFHCWKHMSSFPSDC